MPQGMPGAARERLRPEVGLPRQPPRHVGANILRGLGADELLELARLLVQSVGCSHDGAGLPQ